jgi:L-histidine N-alpha-methyltransferase
MSSTVQLAIHTSQFPENVRRDLLESLRLRQVNHKFHYDSIKQTHRWLALHRAYSPFITDTDCAAVYDRAFEAVAGRLPDGLVHLIGLGCGGGQKDARLLELLGKRGKELRYTPSDVSSAMVLIARQAALEWIEERCCFPLVCDLATTGDLQSVLEDIPVRDAARLISLFGMLPNFEPQLFLPRLAALIRTGEHMLVSANLAPGHDYREGIERILPLYDNPLTREWLVTFLLDLGVEREDGGIHFSIEPDATHQDLQRITAHFKFVRGREIEVEAEHFRFEAGDMIRLFFSYRHTPAIIHSLLGSYGLEVSEEWITRSQEEGVFLVTRRNS